MDFTRIKIVKDDIDKFVNIPINMQWDFMGRDDSIQVYEVEAVKEVIGSPQDFEIIRFAHNIFPNINTEINYVFNFYDYSQPITANTVGNWTVNYLNNGFSVTDVYYFSKSFTNSFFKLDLYDTDDDATRQLFVSIILPVQQGLTQTASLSPTLPPIEIKKPNMVLDSIGNDKEGYYIYWLRSREIIDINTFYMSAQFFDAITGVFKQMTNTRQDLLTPDKFNYDHSQYNYYRVDLDYNTKTYEVFSTSTNLRVGDLLTPITWYEYVNP
jgi:hypothetical protein